MQGHSSYDATKGAQVGTPLLGYAPECIKVDRETHHTAALRVWLLAVFPSANGGCQEQAALVVGGGKKGQVDLQNSHRQ
eukprot:1142025-Pelagomonas_calceolata.AAC.1